MPVVVVVQGVGVVVGWWLLWWWCWWWVAPDVLMPGSKMRSQRVKSIGWREGKRVRADHLAAP